MMTSNYHYCEVPKVKGNNVNKEDGESITSYFIDIFFILFYVIF